MRSLGRFTYHILLIFALLGVLFIPFSFRLLPSQARITQWLFGDLTVFIGAQFEGIHIANPAITSDSTTMYVLMAVLLVLAVMLAATGSVFPFWKKEQRTMVQGIQMVLTFYLSLMMLKYGFDKIFKAQFYLPEPNTLYTPMGMLDRDILYWSSMGTSHLYNVFMGLAEVIPALLLLFSRTRILGLFILTGVLLNVVFVNLGFDISVKLYSSFLLFLCLVLIAPSVRAFFQFFILNKAAALKPLSGKNVVRSNALRLVAKGIVIALLFAEALYPTLQSGVVNEDTIPRLHLHGAYEVVDVEGANKRVAGMDPKRVFIHRQGYLIFQYEDDTLEDFYMKMDSAKREIILTDYDGDTTSIQYSYSESSRMLELVFPEMGLRMAARTLPWRELPLLQPLFHWTVDGAYD